MSGHSKWAKIHRQKGAADAKKSNVFTKISKNITIAAKNGGDPEMNFALRIAIDKAKEANMPKENVEKAIKRGTGEIEGVVYEEVIYEAFGPSGVPILIEAVTDNRNRTTPEVKAILTKRGANLGAQNSVQWMFEHKGVFRISLPDDQDKDDFILSLIDLGAEDVSEEEGALTVYTAFEDYEKVKKALESKNIKTEYAELEWVAKDKLEPTEELSEKIEKIVELLEENEDVNAVFTNLK